MNTKGRLKKQSWAGLCLVELQNTTDKWRVRTATLQADIWTQNLPITKQACYPADRDIRYDDDDYIKPIPKYSAIKSSSRKTRKSGNRTLCAGPHPLPTVAVGRGEQFYRLYPIHCTPEVIFPADNVTGTLRFTTRLNTVPTCRPAWYIAPIVYWLTLHVLVSHSINHDTI